MEKLGEASVERPGLCAGSTIRRRSHCPIEVNETNVKFLRNERAWGLSQRELDRDRGSFAGLGSLGMFESSSNIRLTPFRAYGEVGHPANLESSRGPKIEDPRDGRALRSVTRVALPGGSTPVPKRLSMNVLPPLACITDSDPSDDGQTKRELCKIGLSPKHG
ncbi:hypothetical protein PCH_Pc20g06120 [Penicillium rubens Wisconsin 54-1255]|uniref:Uncharacterized protein n=1 Tax=Penicillium rubens (strain ATCC 28089 / DSM 1075 / NRRL 1951 / Wisconsin 54-1255) TaxID=500485 RepID=B6HG33_PENRW|nr:hypothetical protein PCH_Pc20g06120 [Penicillium rubens Wisconsin 54-1255]